MAAGAIAATGLILALSAVTLTVPALGAEAGPSLDQLSWMVGSWGSEDSGAHMEEHWIEPRGGLMLGLHRDVSASGRAFFEFLRIEETEDGLVYLASPLGKGATPFRSIEVGERRAVFENAENDWPQRLIYWLEDDVLRARAEGVKDGRLRSSEWAWKRLAGSARDSLPDADGKP